VCVCVCVCVCARATAQVSGGSVGFVGSPSHAWSVGPFPSTHSLPQQHRPLPLPCSTPKTQCPTCLPTRGLCHCRAHPPGWLSPAPCPARDGACRRKLAGAPERGARGGRLWRGWWVSSAAAPAVSGVPCRLSPSSSAAALPASGGAATGTAAATACCLACVCGWGAACSGFGTCGRCSRPCSCPCCCCATPSNSASAADSMPAPPGLPSCGLLLLVLLLRPSLLLSRTAGPPAMHAMPAMCTSCWAMEQVDVCACVCEYVWGRAGVVRLQGRVCEHVFAAASRVECAAGWRMKSICLARSTQRGSTWKAYASHAVRSGVAHEKHTHLAQWAVRRGNGSHTRSIWCACFTMDSKVGRA